MQHLTFTVPAAILPTLLLLWYFTSQDVFPEPRRVLLATFGLGTLMVIPVLFVGIPVLLLIVPPLRQDSLVAGALSAAFLAAAIPEEFFKFLVVVFYCSRHPEFDEPMDGIVYGATASLGFATMENVVYVLEGGWEVALTRAFTAVACHAFLGAIMGYYVGQARFHPERRGALLLQGLLTAIVLHGLYDTPLMVLQAAGAELINAHIVFTIGLVAIDFSLLVLMGVWTIRLVQRLHEAQLQLRDAP